MRATTNLVLDLVIAAAFLVAVNPSLLGLPIHEWFGLVFAAVLVAHLVLHFEWIVTAARRVFAGRGRGLRLNSAVDLVLFVSLTAAVLSGLMISKHVMATFGLSPAPNHAWKGIHSFASNTAIVAMGLHLGLHWNWLALNLPRLVTLKARRADADASFPSVAL
jgi:hypothetical protein